MPPRSSRPSATPVAGRGDAQLPAYQPPSAPLNTQGLQSLNRLRNQDVQQKLDDHFKTLNEELGQSAYTVTSSLALQEDWMKKRKAKFGEEDQKYKTRIPTVDKLTERVDALNSALESKVREAIDAQVRQGTRQDALREISANATVANGRAIIAATQSTLGASQYRSRQVEEEDDDDPAEPATPNAGPGIPTLLKQKIDHGNQNYSQLSLGQRYAEHNDYISFRRLLHDGKYAANEAEQPVMPHASTWFDAEGPVFASGTQNPDSTQNNGENDSDVEAVAENVNTKCPITLIVMKDPVKSRKCPHHFERANIELMLKHSTTRVNGRSGQHTVKCPVCDVILTADDLVPDAALKRRIERNAASQSRINGDSDDEDNNYGNSGRGKNRAQTVDSQFEPNLPNLSQIKKERASGVGRRSMAPATQQTEVESRRPLRPPISTSADGTENNGVSDEE